LSAGLDFSAVIGFALDDGAWMRRKLPSGRLASQSRRFGRDFMRHLVVRSFDPTQTGPVFC
jgi:hypothetical protein